MWQKPALSDTWSYHKRQDSQCPSEYPAPSLLHTYKSAQWYCMIDQWYSFYLFHHPQTSRSLSFSWNNFSLINLLFIMVQRATQKKHPGKMSSNRSFEIHLYYLWQLLLPQVPELSLHVANAWLAYACDILDSHARHKKEIININAASEMFVHHLVRPMYDAVPSAWPIHVLMQLRIRKATVPGMLTK